VSGAPLTSNSTATESGATGLNTHQDLGIVSIVPVPKLSALWPSKGAPRIRHAAMQRTQRKIGRLEYLNNCHFEFYPRSDFKRHIIRQRNDFRRASDCSASEKAWTRIEIVSLLRNVARFEIASSCQSCNLLSRP
jgi:hypothetical protein